MAPQPRQHLPSHGSDVACSLHWPMHARQVKRAVPPRRRTVPVRICSAILAEMGPTCQAICWIGFDVTTSTALQVWRRRQGLRQSCGCVISGGGPSQSLWPSWQPGWQPLSCLTSSSGTWGTKAPGVGLRRGVWGEPQQTRISPSWQSLNYGAARKQLSGCRCAVHMQAVFPRPPLP